MTASMINPSANLNGVHPDKILCILVPRGLKLLLTYWARGVSKGGVIGNRYVFIFGVILCRSGSRQRFGCFYPICRPFDPFISSVPVLDPFLVFY